MEKCSWLAGGVAPVWPMELIFTIHSTFLKTPGAYGLRESLRSFKPNTLEGFRGTFHGMLEPLRNSPEMVSWFPFWDDGATAADLNIRTITAVRD